MDEIILTLGEKRKLTMDVWLSTGEAFTLQNSTWSLLFAKIEEASGECEVTPVTGNHYHLVAEIQPTKKGVYELSYSFHLGTEIVIRTVIIKVV